MTPFESWYSREVAPKLPNDLPPQIRQASKEAMAACWNAALDAAQETTEQIDADEINREHDGKVCACFLDDLRARVTP
jgi:hypothetical protein